MLKKNKNKHLRLLHITSSLKIGGAETLLVSLIDKLRKYPFEQQVICFHDGPNGDKIRKLGVPVFCIKGLLYRYDPFFFLRLIRILRRLRPDVLHSLLWAANFTGRIIAHILKIPIVCGLHNNCDQNGNIRNVLDCLTTRTTDKFVAVSQEVKKSALVYMPTLSCQSIKVITNGIDISGSYKMAFRFKKERSLLGLSNHNFVVGSVGRLVAIKNYFFFINQLKELVRHYPHVRFVLVGTGPQECLLRKEIKENMLDDYVIMIIDQPALPYYLLFDCFILPSYKEGISMALLEAMSFGLPCIVGNHCLQHSVIESGKNGLVVTPKESFAQALMALIENEKLRKSLSREAYVSVSNNFYFDNIVKLYADMFRSLSNRI